MSERQIRNVIEAALLAAGRPLQPAELVGLFDLTSRPSEPEVREELAALTAEYADRGVEIKETAAGFRVQVRREFANEISRLWPERPPRFSRALLETLALIAYRQPITRGEIESVRGVAVNPNIIKTLLERNWVRVAGHRDVPGRPELLGTTREFLDYFGLKSLDELPPLAELKAMGDLNVQLDFGETGRVSDPGASVESSTSATGESSPVGSRDESEPLHRNLPDGAGAAEPGDADSPELDAADADGQEARAEEESEDREAPPTGLVAAGPSDA